MYILHGLLSLYWSSVLLNFLNSFSFYLSRRKYFSSSGLRLFPLLFSVFFLRTSSSYLDLFMFLIPIYVILYFTSLTYFFLYFIPSLHFFFSFYVLLFSYFVSTLFFLVSRFTPVTYFFPYFISSLSLFFTLNVFILLLLCTSYSHFIYFLILHIRNHNTSQK